MILISCFDFISLIILASIEIILMTYLHSVDNRCFIYFSFSFDFCHFICLLSLS
jgi:hypothetical protein